MAQLDEDEDALLRSVALQNANSILRARQRAEEQLLAAQKELRESAARLELALSAGRLGDWSWDVASDVVTLGPRAAEIFGVPQERAITWAGLRERVHEEDREGDRIALQEALAQGGEYGREFRVRHHPSGELYWVAAHGRGTYSETKSMTRMTGVVEDITQRKRAEEALRQSQARLQMAVEAGQMGDWEWVLSTGEVRWSAALEALHGLAPGEFGGGFADFQRDIHPDDRERVLATIGRCVEERCDYRIEYRIIKPDGTLSWIEARGKLSLDAEGAPERMTGICMDITQRKQAEEERKRLLESERSARSAAERMSALKDEFLATLSHELRTPLSAILGWSQILRRGVKSEADLHKGLDTIERNARMQTRLIEDLLDMSRITSGKVRLDIQPVAPVAFIEAAIETVRPAADAKGIRLDKLLDPAAGPISGDPARLQQVVWNLLSNAIKFTPKAGKVQVVLERVNSHIEITVADSGVGIKPEFLAHVFERFRQADASTTRAHGGLGLGLSIVKNLVELHGGTVHARSEGEGCGATFAVRLPLAIMYLGSNDGSRVHPQTPPLVAHEFRVPDLSGIRVLVVDDEPDARELIKRVLCECDAEVISAGSAAEALELVRKHRPHVLVSDIGMPDVDGFELLKRVRALGEAAGGRVPAIALTAFARSDDRTRALRAGFLVHVSKPVEPSELVATVATVAGRTGDPTTT